MNNLIKRWGLPTLAVIVLLLMVAWMAGFFSNKLAPGAVQNTPINGAQALGVNSASYAIYEAVPASVEAKQATVISARIMARITSIKVRSGDDVTQGQLLLTLEKTDLTSKVKQAGEQIRAITARLTEAQQNLERATKLQKQGLLAAADLDKARANHDALKADLAAAQQAQQETNIAVSYSEIRAPIDGRVVDRFAEPGDTAAPGNKLLTLYNPLTLRVEAQVREQLALTLQENQRLRVEIPALNLKLDAELEERVPAADPGSRSFLIKVRMPFNAQLQPGMYARLLVPAGEREQIRIPADRIVTVGQLDLVWVLQDGQAYRRFVKLGNTYGDQIEVLSGLSDGDKILPIPDRATSAKDF
ncbi:efflux RND transporter periplasmic adaptor subunit [Simiduia litorea]|uniref:efflux RND transporter periplasmic adaptor subunit n=1 Tax=Simiduia litorea TaxID=1435348 RepID=UPI0036F24AD1